MADADSDSQELTFSSQKNPSKDALKGKRKGKNAAVSKEGLIKSGMNNSGRAVLVSGTSTQLPYGDAPVDLSSDDKDLVLEYSDMYEPSKGAGYVDIQDGDAVSESSDTEIVAHTNEQVQYDNQPSSSDSSSENDYDDDHGPPPLNSDDEDDDDNDDDDDDSVEGPPPLDSDDNVDNRDYGDDLATPPSAKSREELNSKRAAVSNEQRGLRGSDNDSDSEGDVKEAPPPLDSEEEEEEEEEEIEDSSSAAENMGLVAHITEDQVHDSPAEDVEVQYDDEDDSGGDSNDKDQDFDKDDENEQESDDGSVGGDNNQHDSIYDNQEEFENLQAVPHNLELGNSDKSEHSDSAAEVDGERDVEQHDSGTDEGSEIENDRKAGWESVGEVHHVTPVANAEVSGDTLADDTLQSGELKDAEETDIRKDIAHYEQSENQSAAVTPARKDSDVLSSDKDNENSPVVVPDEDDENELEWDVEDFDLPKHKNTKRTKATSKIDSEGAEVEKLKKSFLDTLRSEAGQTKVVGIAEKTGTKKKEKPNDKNSKIVQVNVEQEKKEEEKKRIKASLKPVSVQELKSVPGTARRTTMESSPKTELAKVEKKKNKDGTNLAVSKPAESVKKAAKNKSKALDSTLEKTDGQKAEKQKKDVKEISRTSKMSESMPVAKVSKVKSSSVSSLATAASDQKTSKGIKQTKKAAKPVDNAHSDSRKAETLQKQRGERKVRKSDSDNCLDSSTRQTSQKATSSEQDSKPKKSNALSSQTHKRREKAVETEDTKQPKSRQISAKSVPIGIDREGGNHHENKRGIEVPMRSAKETKSKGRPTSNGHLSSSHEKLSLHPGRHDHSTLNHEAHHRHSSHTHDRGKHVWLCRDDEIHKLIAQKASLLKEYESGSLAGRRVFSGHKSNMKRGSDPADVPDVGFISSKQTRRHQSRPLSEAIPPDRAPYSSQRREKRLSLQLDYSGSSSDDDERTNRAVESKRGGTFAVGLAARNKELKRDGGSDTDHEETCEYCAAEKAAAAKAREQNPAWEGPHHPRNLLLGVVYSAKYLGSSQIMSPQSPNKAVRMEQAQEAVGRIKVPEGEEQPTTDIDLFISTERLKVVNSSTKEVMLDHALRTVSFIADIGDVLVLMARQPPEEHTSQVALKPSQILASVGSAQTDHKAIKITCHVFQSPEAQVMAKSIGQAFNVAYQEFLRQNGLSDDVVEDAEYNGVLEAQKILGEDLSLLADENSSKEVVVNKKPHEYLGVMIVESGWGSMIPCAIIAHLAKEGPAAKSGRLNVGDQILSVNGTSLVGLPLWECQNIIKGIRPNTKVVLKIVSCPPTVQVVVNRPDTKYQLGFSVQNGMICSLMRGSIAERGGVRVGHRIIEINDESVVATSHQHIVELLATTVGEIRMKTMPASMYRLLVGLENPQHI